MPSKNTTQQRPSATRDITAMIEYARYYADLGVASSDLNGISGVVLLLKEVTPDQSDRYFHSVWAEENIRSLTSKKSALTEKEMVDFAFSLSTRKAPVKVMVKPSDEISVESMLGIHSDESEKPFFRSGTELGETSAAEKQESVEAAVPKQKSPTNNMRMPRIHFPKKVQ